MSCFNEISQCPYSALLLVNAVEAVIFSIKSKHWNICDQPFIQAFFYPRISEVETQSLIELQNSILSYQILSFIKYYQNLFQGT